MSKPEANKLVHEWEQMNPTQLRRALEPSLSSLPKEYRELAEELRDAWSITRSEVNTEYGDRRKYLTDLVFGIRMYRILSKMGMDVRLASYDALWIYLSMKVVPYIVFDRFSKFEESGHSKIPADHYFVKSVRIYLKSLWWYIFLSAQTGYDGRPDLEKTQEMLWNQNTDTILQLVERSGREGYRVDLYREIMKYYCEHPELESADFRRVLILNTARSQVMEPALTEDGIRGYVKGLFDYIKE